MDMHNTFADYLVANSGGQNPEPSGTSADPSTQSNIWKPSAHSPPFAYFDTQTNHTRLTWCERDSHEMG